MATGGELIIDESFIKNLVKADKAIRNISDSASNAERSMMSWISKLNSGSLTSFVEGLENTRKQYDLMSQSLSEQRGFKTFSRECAKAADEVQNLINIISKTSHFNLEINAQQGLQDLKAISDQIDANIRKEQEGLRINEQIYKEKEKSYNELFKLQERNLSQLVSSYETEIRLSKQAQEAKETEMLSMKRFVEQRVAYEQSLNQRNIDNRDRELINQWQEQQRLQQKSMDDYARMKDNERKEKEKALEYALRLDEEEEKKKEKLRAEAIKQEREARQKAEKERIKRAREANLKEQELEKTRYENWLLRKKSEENENKRIEEAKRRESQRTFQQQQAEFKRIAELKAAQSLTNQQTKDNSANMIRYRREQERMYEQMFDEIAQKERSLKQQIFEENLRRYNGETQQRKRLEQQIRDTEKRNHDARQREYDELGKILDRNEKRQRAVANAKADTSQGALNYTNRMYSDKGVLSINNMQKALSLLQEAQQRLNLKTAEGRKKYDELGQQIKRVEKDLKNATKSVEGFKSESDKLGRAFSQLKTQLTALFSIAAIKGYIQQLVNVRQEFEKQQTALKGILQSKDEADKLWNQTTQLALKSPFSIRELITYTKQLSAYRIETDKLHDTTKQLADVSAGLGVDMSRLILAYGQVRAAEYLRGTELRQFTEAGIPMLEELARYFTEVEGRAISTADVFDMISKRMVEFEDVAEVFNRMTSEGGVFFEMQEQQSKTLYGELSNLKDAYELMLNEIGENNEGVIKNTIQQARNLLQSWKDVAFALKIALTAFAAIKTSMYLYKLGTQNATTTTLWFNKALKSNIGTSLEMIRTFKWSETTMMGVTKMQFLLGKATLYVQGAVRGLFALIKTFAPFAIIAGISYLIEKLTEASRKAEELRQNLNEIIYSDKSNLEDTIEEYKNLYSRLELVNKGSIEHSNIISKLNSQYGEYLDFVVNENTTIQQLADSYDTLVERMTATAQLKSYEKSIGEIHEQSKQEIAAAVEDYNFFMKKGFKQSDDPLFKLIPTKKEIDNIYAIIRQKIRETNAEQLDNYGEQANFLNKIINEFYGKELNPFSSTYLPPIVDELIKVKKQEKIIQEEINALYTKTYKTQEQLMRFEQKKNEFAEKKRQIEKSLTNEFEKQKELQKLKDQEAIEVINLEFELGLRSRKNADDAIKEITDWMKPLTQSINDAIKLNLSELYSEEELSKVLINKDLQNNKSISNYIKDVKNEWEITNKLILEQIGLKSAGHKIDEEHLTKLQKREQLYRRTAEIAGVELKYTQRMNEETRQAINSMFDDNLVITLEEAWGGFDNVLKNLNEKANEQELIIRQLNKHKKEGLPIDEKALENAEQLFVWTKKRLALLDPKSDKKINEHRLQEINERLEKEYRIDIIDSQKSESQLLADANSEKEKAIAYEKQLLDMKKEGLSVTDQELSDAKKAVEQTTLKWDLLGGEEEVKEPKKRTLKETIDDAIRIVKDAHDDYKKVSKTIDHTAAKTLALAKNANAFAEAVKGIPSLAKFKLDDFAFDQEDGAIESLEKLKTLIPTTAKNYKSLMVDIEKAIGDLRGEATIEAKVKADEELIQSIEEMFDGYELSLELDKLGLPKNFMSDLFNINTFNLDQIRTKIENEISRIKSSAETKQGEKDRLKELEKQLQKVDDMEEKQMQERLKKYSKYLLKSQSEAVKIKLDELRQIEEIESLQNVSSAQKNAMKQGVKDETQKKLDKNAWDTFKEDETYIRLFEDLEYQSVKSLRSMRSELTQMRDNLKNLDPSALKEISDKIDSLDEQIVKRNPFKALGQAYKDFISVYKRYGSEKELEDKLQQSINDRDSTSALIYNQELDVRQAQKKVDDALLSNDKVRIANAKLNLSIQENTLNTLKEKFKNDEKIVELLDEALSKLQKSQKMFSGGIGEIGGDISAVASSLPTIMGDLESMGIRFSEEMRDSVESISEIGQGVGNAIQGFASGNYLQGIMGVTSALAGIFKIGDKSKERRIKREIRLIEDLGRQYEKLQKQIDNAYSLDTFRESYAEAQKNLDEQIAATERMIEAEKAKKNTDNERIKEWQHQLEEYEQQKQELLDKQLQELGGFGESGYKDAAQQFVDAWVEAFRETGDGLSALEDKWDEYIQNVIRKQMSMKIANKFVEPLLTELDKALEDDSYLSTEELEKIDKLSKDAFPKLNEALQQISELYGSEWLKTNGELSDLTSGIQGVTEHTDDQLAGLINSIRLYVANNNRELLNIANTLKESLQFENPMLSQLKLIATHTDNINTLLESVVGQYHSGGRGIKVIM